MGIKLAENYAEYDHFITCRDTLISIEGVITTTHDDYLYGDEGTNYFEDYGGYDEYFGSGGTDDVSYTHSTTGVAVNLVAGLQTSGGHDALNGIEDIYGSPHNDVFYGNNEANYFSGGGGSDEFHGDSGADFFFFDEFSVTDARSGVFDTILDYDCGNSLSHAYDFNEGDLINLTAAIGSLFPTLLPNTNLNNLVYAQEEVDGTNSSLYLWDNNARWIRIAELAGIHNGDFITLRMHPTDVTVPLVTIAVGGSVGQEITLEFDFPMGSPDSNGRLTATPQNDGDGYYDANDFGVFTDNIGANDYHLGEDWNYESGGASDLGAPVLAAASGTVVFAGDGGTNWGNVVILKHPMANGAYGGFVTTLYGHLGNFSVSAGDLVQRGQQVGEIGQVAGLSPHLHFEVREGSNPGAEQVGAGYSTTPQPTGWLDPTDFILSHRGAITTNNIISVSASSINGTSGNDTIDNQGYWKNHTIDGGAGTDTAIFFDDAAHFSITTLSAFHYTQLQQRPVTC